MPADLRILDSDQTTPIVTLSEGDITTPGAATSKLLYVENFGDADATSLTVTCEQVGTGDGINFAQLALDSGGSPGTWTTSPLSLGTLAASATVPFWARASVPAGRTADNNPRRYDLVADALST